ncbi:MAG: hypothetical protein DWQ06_13225 [Calditrichaeota bacterium]|nr:MAG: hypothetical protein DWQ06_13225 [Calditrichota bacterium]
MTESKLKNEILFLLERMNTEQQKKLFNFMTSLNVQNIKGVSGKSLLNFTGLFEKEDLQEIEVAINENCSGIDLNEW